VLVVDDDPDLRHLWELWLTFWGFAVEEASNGLEAIKKARTFQPHLVLMDIWMPVLDGLIATRTLKADPAMKDVPVLALSADSFPPAQERAFEAGCEAFLPKPVNPDALLDNIRVAMRRLIARRQH
jgi:CheY-like chemotaxis protein